MARSVIGGCYDVRGRTRLQARSAWREAACEVRRARIGRQADRPDEEEAMTNPRDPEGLMPDADVSGGPADEAGRAGADASPFDLGAEELSGANPLLDDDGSTDALAGRTDVDQFGSDPDVRFPGDSEDPTMSTADARANAVPGEDGGAV
jgi:hypothetical protein